MNGAEYIAEFLYRQGLDKVFLMTGGACAFMVDAVSRHLGLSHYSFQHEQACAMAADAMWRVNRQKIGVTMSTSGPGAMNLVTGIACSYFDSIPSLHITGQVNLSESKTFGGAAVRQIGFQETNIVSMVQPITKYAVQVGTEEELRAELSKACEIALSDRMGPVLIDVPMDLQQKDFSAHQDDFGPNVMGSPHQSQGQNEDLTRTLNGFLGEGKRPLVLVGAGVCLAGVEKDVSGWLNETKLPFVCSWNAMNFVDHDASGYMGNIGVYGNRGANFALQNCDRLLVLGSRLDNRQRSGNAAQFAPQAEVCVVDVDGEELQKYSEPRYQTILINLRDLPNDLDGIQVPPVDPVWSDYIAEMKGIYFGKTFSSYALKSQTICPYEAVRKISALAQEDAIVAVDTGATLCWTFQAFHRKRQTIFTDGGCSAMGYSLPAAIGAKIENRETQVLCVIGDGGYQVNIQELQTIANYGLDIKIIVFNNQGYGIIRQFQDSYLESRYEAVGHGDKHPNYQAISEAWGFRHVTVEHIDQLTPEVFESKGAAIIEIVIDPNTPIEPKLEMGRPINDQFPYLDDEAFSTGNRFVEFNRPRDQN